MEFEHIYTVKYMLWVEYMRQNPGHSRVYYNNVMKPYINHIAYGKRLLTPMDMNYVLKGPIDRFWRIFKRMVLDKIEIKLEQHNILVKYNWACCDHCAQESLNDLVKRYKKSGYVYCHRQNWYNITNQIIEPGRDIVFALHWNNNDKSIYDEIFVARIISLLRKIKYLDVYLNDMTEVIWVTVNVNKMMKAWERYVWS
jgi:hypothetical protein